MGGQTAEQGGGVRQARTAVKGVERGPNGQRVVVLLKASRVDFADHDGVANTSKASRPSCSLGVHVEDPHKVAVIRVRCSTDALLEEDFVSLDKSNWLKSG